ncbi:MAG: hypothetical protein IPI11_17780, partial [Haliscomenobacter sp.]|nr:hypothetical protein [Haliscomenobacter sp.]
MMEEIVPRLDAIYDNIRHRERTGEWLYPITTEAGKVASLVKARNTERTAASRWRRLIRQSDSDDAKRMEYENK